eukprot:jgi/Phyca11/103636/e_gw1.8.104.1
MTGLGRDTLSVLILSLTLNSPTQQACLLRQYSQDLRDRIIWKWKEGHSQRSISDHLCIPRRSIRSILDNFHKHGHANPLPRTGRPRKTDARQDRAIVRSVERNRFSSAVTLAAQVSEQVQATISRDLTRDRLRATGLHGRSARKKIFLSPRHRRLRLAYAHRFGNMNAEFWSRVLFTDEASVELNGTTGRVYVWQRPNEAFDPRCVLPTFKSGRQKLMVWSSISADGVGTLHFCDESVTGEYYRHLLRQEIPITKQFLAFSGETLFVHDNAPAHSAKLTAQCLRELNLISLGPDLNPIENMWFIMKMKLSRCPATSIDDLKRNF